MLLYSKNYVFHKDNFFADKAQKIYRKNAACEKVFCNFCDKKQPQYAIFLVT